VYCVFYKEVTNDTLHDDNLNMTLHYVEDGTCKDAKKVCTDRALTMFMRFFAVASNSNHV
jgi:hypothetical protein